MLRRISLVTLCLLGLFLTASAKKEKNKTPEMTVAEWAREQSSKLPEEVEGVHMFRPEGTDADGRVRTMGMLDLKGVGKEQAFTSALIAVSKEIDRETDAIETVDFDKMRFIVYREIPEGEYTDARTYRFTTAFQFDDELMTFSCYDVNIEFKEKGIIPRKLNLEKFKPANNERHRDIVEGFSLASSRMIDAVRKGVVNSAPVVVTHWPEIKAGTVVRGMNEEEVRLIGGEPRSVNNSGNRVQWMYSNDFVVIFENGKVCNVMQ